MLLVTKAAVTMPCETDLPVGKIKNSRGRLHFVKILFRVILGVLWTQQDGA